MFNSLFIETCAKKTQCLYLKPLHSKEEKVKYSLKQEQEFISNQTYQSEAQQLITALKGYFVFASVYKALEFAVSLYPLDSFR